MTNTEMNMEKVIKRAERIILRQMSVLEDTNDGLSVNVNNLSIAVATAIITEASKANPSEMAIDNMWLALDTLLELSESSYDGLSTVPLKDYCCSILYLNGRTRYNEQSMRKFAFRKAEDSKILKELNTVIDITLKAMNLK